MPKAKLSITEGSVTAMVSESRSLACQRPQDPLQGPEMRPGEPGGGEGVPLLSSLILFIPFKETGD